MKMIVRFGVDACLPSPDSSATTTSIDEPDPADVLSDARIQQPSIPTSTSTTSPAINIVRAGTQVPQDALVEMTSRSKFYLNQVDWNELYPQLALSQTPSLRMGLHERGEFTELREWQLDGHGAQVDAGMVGRRQSCAQKGVDVTDLSLQRQGTAVQIVRLARTCRSSRWYVVPAQRVASVSYVRMGSCVCTRARGTGTGRPCVGVACRLRWRLGLTPARIGTRMRDSCRERNKHNVPVGHMDVVQW